MGEKVAGRKESKKKYEKMLFSFLVVANDAGIKVDFFFFPSLKQWKDICKGFKKLQLFFFF